MTLVNSLLIWISWYISILLALNLILAQISAWYALKGFVKSYIKFSLYPDFCDLLTFCDLSADLIKIKPIYYERAHQDEQFEYKVCHFVMKNSEVISLCLYFARNYRLRKINRKATNRGHFLTYCQVVKMLPKFFC